MSKIRILTEPDRAIIVDNVDCTISALVLLSFAIRWHFLKCTHNYIASTMVRSPSLSESDTSERSVWLSCLGTKSGFFLEVVK